MNMKMLLTVFTKKLFQIKQYMVQLRIHLVYREPAQMKQRLFQIFHT